MSKLPLGSRITPSYIRRIRHLITSMRAEMLSEISFSARIFMTMDDPIPALKQRLAQAILEEIGERNMWIAGRILGLDQPEMWNLEHGRLRRFSVHKLIRLLARINRQVEITVVAVGPLPTRADRMASEAAEKARELNTRISRPVSNTRAYDGNVRGE